MPLMVPDKEVDIENDAFRQWKELHEYRIGSSEAAAAVGFSPYTTPLQLYRKKLGLGLEESEGPGEAAEWGLRLEGPVIQWMADRFDLEVDTEGILERIGGSEVFEDLGTFDFKFGESQRLLRSGVWEHMVYSPDGLCFTNSEGYGIVEAKTTNGWTFKRDWGAEPPNHVVIQCQHAMAVTGLSYAVVPVLVDGRKPKCYLVNREDEIIAGLAAITASFVDMLQARTPPNVQPGSDDLDTIKAVYPDADGPEIELPESSMEHLEKWLRAREQIKHWKEVKGEAELVLRGLIGSHESASVGNRLVTLKQTVRKAYTPKPVAETAYRTLRVKGVN